MTDAPTGIPLKILNVFPARNFLVNFISVLRPVNNVSAARPIIKSCTQVAKMHGEVTDPADNAQLGGEASRHWTFGSFIARDRLMLSVIAWSSGISWQCRTGSFCKRS